MNYQIEEMKLLNMKKVSIHVSNPRLRDGLKIYEIENILSEDEKLAFIDDMRDGVGTYMVKLLTKWEEEKDSLPSTHGKPKTVSHKAWLKRNDTRKMFSEFSIDTYYLFGTEFKNMSLICPKAGYNYDMEHTGKPIVHQWFHDLCKELEKMERKYFQENDPTQIKLAKVVELGNRYQIFFDDELLHDIVWNRETNVTDVQLDTFLAAYEELEKKIESITQSLKEHA